MDAYRQRSLVFLNNRHYDPTLGAFISVDPLVTKTGEPYIYGAANPVTMSDPSGLDPDTASVTRHRAYDYCILTLDCSNKNLADSIKKTPDRLGGAVFTLWDTANQGWLPDADGNLDRSDLEAASTGRNLELLSWWLTARLGGGGDAGLAGFLASLAQNAAGRLIGDRDLWESIDKDLSFVQRNSEVLGAGSFVLGVASLGACTVCVYAGYASLAGSAVMTGDACAGGRRNSCAAGVASMFLPINVYSTRALATTIGTTTRIGRLAQLQNWASLTLETAAIYQSVLGSVVSGGVFGGDSIQWWSSGP